MVTMSSLDNSQLLKWLEDVEKSVVNRDGKILTHLFAVKNVPHLSKPFLIKLTSQKIHHSIEKYFANRKVPFANSLRIVTENFLEICRECTKNSCQWNNVISNGTMLLNGWIEIYRDPDALPCQWLVPVLIKVCSFLSRAGIIADSQLNVGYFENDDNDEDYQNKYQITVLNAIRQQIGKFRGDEDRQAGYIVLMTESIKCCMQLRNMQMASTFLKHIELSNIDSSKVLRGPMVLFRYFLGKLYMQQENFLLSEEQLAWAFGHSNFKNVSFKRNILECLIAVRLRLGLLPSLKLLKKYKMHHYMEVREAILQGNVKRFEKTLHDFSANFIHHGTILCVERVKFIVYRNLMRRIRSWSDKNLPGDPNKISFSAFEAGFKWQSDEIFDQQEMACICANLIKLGYVKGYISWEHQVIVFSANDPFPSFKNIKAL
ncbi:hypothetical protein cand_036680 [Cryptosporidium andersoni]|uniref:Uncharacterized protein n=1 Tax=Cryptosporidium andersoni TaxID=117008 RepID=A0A1J4MY73_9CRYT|nr:hypothetical protein cand_036680 [Cryptosporidium andersoni]